MRMAVRYLFRTGGATFQGFFQAPDNAAVAMQVGVRLAAPRVFNSVALLITHAVMKQGHLILFDWHRVLCDGSTKINLSRFSLFKQGQMHGNCNPNENGASAPLCSEVKGQAQADAVYGRIVCVDISHVLEVTG